MPKNFEEVVQIPDPDNDEVFYTVDQDMETMKYHAFFIDESGEATEELAGPATYAQALHAIAAQFEADSNPEAEPQVIEGKLV